MKIGIGYGNLKNSELLAEKIAENAIKDGAIREPSLVIAFCGGQVDHNIYYNGLRNVIGPTVPIIGGSAIGIITNDYVSYEGCPAGAVIIESSTLQLKTASAGNLDEDEKQAGKKLGKKLANTIAGKILLMFYDSVKKLPAKENPLIINASLPLIEGIEECLIHNPIIIGGGLLKDYDFSQPLQFCGFHVARQSVVGVLLDGDFTPYFTIMHGCIPKDGIYHTITKSEGSIIYEVDGKPIVATIDEQYGSKDWRNQVPVARLTLGMNRGDKYEDFKEVNYVNRLIAGVLPGERGIVLFEPDLKEGTKFQFMLRNNKKMIASARESSEKLIAKIVSDKKQPVLGFYIDCAGRAAKASDTLTEEASYVQNTFNTAGVPLFGFYSGVEIAPFREKSRGLDWTGVLLVLAEG